MDMDTTPEPEMRTAIRRGADDSVVMLGAGKGQDGAGRSS